MCKFKVESNIKKSFPGLFCKQTNLSPPLFKSELFEFYYYWFEIFKQLARFMR